MMRRAQNLNALSSYKTAPFHLLMPLYAAQTLTTLTSNKALECIVVESRVFKELRKSDLTLSSVRPSATVGCRLCRPWQYWRRKKGTGPTGEIFATLFLKWLAHMDSTVGRADEENYKESEPVFGSREVHME